MMFVSSLAIAKTPYDICDGMFASADKIKCLETVRGKQFNAAATDICASMFSSGEQLSCLNTIADKDYVPQETKICGGLFAGADKQNCLARVGSSTLCPNTQTAKTALENVLNLIATSNYHTAYAAANDLLEHYQACSK
jgi:hypothetical protein